MKLQKVNFSSTIFQTFDDFPNIGTVKRSKVFLLGWWIFTKVGIFVEVVSLLGVLKENGRVSDREKTNVGLEIDP